MKKKYYVGFLSNDKDHLFSYSCYDEDSSKITFTSYPDAENLAYIFNDKNIKESWIHFFEVEEVITEVTEEGYRSEKKSSYLKSYSNKFLSSVWSEIKYKN